MTKVVIDTNILLDNPEVLQRTDIEIVVPYVVLSELDKLKRNPELSFSARSAIKNLLQLYKEGKLQIVGVPEVLETNDEKIVQEAVKCNAKLWSRDGGANVIALTKGVEQFEEYVSDYDKSYIGYRYLETPDELYYHLINMNNELQIPEVEEPLKDILDKDPISINEYVVFRPSDGSENIKIFRKTTDKFVHVSDSRKIFKQLSKEGRRVDIDFLHPEQAMAFDAVFNTDTPLAVIQGSVGSSKSLMATLGALCRVGGTHANKKYSQILVTRPTMPTHRQWEIGFVPGTAEEKMSHWLAGFTSNIEFLFNHTQEDYEKEVAKTVFKEYFQPIALDSIQGSSFNGKILLVDECYHPSTEILTENGWYRFDELPKDLKVLQVNQDTGVGTFVEPIRYVQKPYSGTLVHFKSDTSIDLMVTPQHDFLTYRDGKPRKVKAEKVAKGNKNFVLSAPRNASNTVAPLTPYERLVIATQAVGGTPNTKRIAKSDPISFSFSKDRKIQELLCICSDGILGENTKEKGNLWDTFTLSNLSQPKAKAIIAEAMKWGGLIHPQKPISGGYTTCSKDQADFIQAVAIIAGYPSRVSILPGNKSPNTVYRVFIQFTQDTHTTQYYDINNVPYTGDVYCVTVPDGNILVRGKGKAVVCGNCQLLDVDTLKQVMTRTANGSKLVLILDVNQAYGAWRGREGYKKLLPHLKNNPLVSYVNLQNIYRSELTSFVNDIFK
jgi:predicted ribonuclease YlaK